MPHWPGARDVTQRLSWDTKVQSGLKKERYFKRPVQLWATAPEVAQ
jgi:hypothetical protein